MSDGKRKPDEQGGQDLKHARSEAPAAQGGQPGMSVALQGVVQAADSAQLCSLNLTDIQQIDQENFFDSAQLCSLHFTDIQQIDQENFFHIPLYGSHAENNILVSDEFVAELEGIIDEDSDYDSQNSMCQVILDTLHSVQAQVKDVRQGARSKVVMLGPSGLGKSTFTNWSAQVRFSLIVLCTLGLPCIHTLFHALLCTCAT